jgi:hypothetical protein
MPAMLFIPSFVKNGPIVLTQKRNKHFVLTVYKSSDSLNANSFQQNYCHIIAHTHILKWRRCNVPTIQRYITYTPLCQHHPNTCMTSLENEKKVHDLRIPPRFEWDLRSSGMLHSGRRCATSQKSEDLKSKVFLVALIFHTVSHVASRCCPPGSRTGWRWCICQ